MDNESKLREVLRLAIADANNRPKTFENKLKKSMVYMYNVPAGDTVEMLNGKIPLEGISLDTAYKLTRVLYELNKTEENGFDIKLLDVDKYFNKNQKVYFEQKTQDEELIGDIVFDNYLQFGLDQYAVTASIDEIIKWRDSRRIKYNEKTQRKMTVKESKGVEIKTVTLNPKARKNIHELMVNNDFIPNFLALNINPDDNEELPYVTNDGKLVIPKGTDIDISDGFHRYIEMTSVKDDDPDWDFICGFYITLFDEEKANKFIWQEDHKTHLAKEQKETMMKSDEVNYLLGRLNDSSNFHHKGKLNDEILFVLNKSIHHMFEDKTNKIDRQTGITLYKSIETNINQLIEKENCYNENFTKQEWFVYIIALYYCLRDNISFMRVIDKLKTKDLSSIIDFKNEPRVKHFRQLSKVIEEVI